MPYGRISRCTVNFFARHPLSAVIFFYADARQECVMPATPVLTFKRLHPPFEATHAAT
jgi:hypothetical protein